MEIITHASERQRGKALLHYSNKYVYMYRIKLQSLMSSKGMLGSCIFIDLLIDNIESIVIIMLRDPTTHSYIIVIFVVCYMLFSSLSEIKILT